MFAPGMTAVTLTYQACNQVNHKTTKQIKQNDCTFKRAMRVELLWDILQVSYLMLIVQKCRSSCHNKSNPSSSVSKILDGTTEEKLEQVIIFFFLNKQPSSWHYHYHYHTHSYNALWTVQNKTNSSKSTQQAYICCTICCKMYKYINKHNRYQIKQLTWPNGQSSCGRRPRLSLLPSHGWAEWPRSFDAASCHLMMHETPTSIWLCQLAGE